ncbi:MAG: hypothetical protein WHS88_12480 [Anaerohalosphaeraceae bacterium]
MVAASPIFDLIFLAGFLLSNTPEIPRKVVAMVAGRPVTNIQVLEAVAIERESRSPEYNIDSIPFSYLIFDNVLEEMLPVFLFEQYASQNGIHITEQEVWDCAEKDARKYGKSLAESLQSYQTPYEDSENARKRLYKVWYKYLLYHRVVEHYDPNVNTVTEEDIQAWAADRKKKYRNLPIGEPEQIRYRAIAVTSADYAEKASVQEEFDRIRARLNKGELFEAVAKDYADKEGYSIKGIGHQPTDWVLTSVFEKQGFEALTSWKSLKNKAIVVKTKGLPFVMVMRVDDYKPDTQMSIEEAIRRKPLPSEVVENAKAFKFFRRTQELTDRLRDQMGAIVYVGGKKEVCQELEEQYKLYREQRKLREGRRELSEKASDSGSR